MGRGPPAEVCRRLRKEVNYCCPVPGCGEPFLTWHHFDPPWREEQHHRPEDMIALCWKHHLQAEAGTFGIREIRGWKQSPNPVSLARAKFDWFGREPVIRLGGCYAVHGCLVTLSGEKVLHVYGDQGLLSVDFLLNTPGGETLARMEANVLTFFPDQLHDLSVSASGHRIKVWLEERRIGLELEYSRRTLVEIERQIQADTPRYDDVPFPVDPPEPIEDPDRFYRELRGLSDFRSEIMPIAFRRRDPVGTLIRWQAARRLEEDGRVPLLNVVGYRLNGRGQSIEMRNGKFESMEFCAATRFEFNGDAWSMS